MRSTLLTFILCLLTSVAHAASPDVVLAPPAQPPAAGSAAVFFVYYHNTGDQPMMVTPDPQQACRLIAADGSAIDTQAAISPPSRPETHSIPPGGFLKVGYQIQLPEDLKSPVQLVIPKLGNPGLYFEVRAPQIGSETFGSWLPKPTDEPLDALIQLYQPYVKNISFYEPMYFLVGTEPKYSKFQLSLKYRLFNTEKSFTKKHPWLKGLHFGYTQTSFWDLASDSAPFEDTSYKPEAFFISDRMVTRIPSLDGLFFKTGLRHESNGRGGEFSRSTNTAYIQPIFIFYNKGKRTGLKISPKFWLYFGNEDENNPDLERYRGYFNLQVTIGKAEGLVLDSKFWCAAAGGSVQIDATYPLHTLIFTDLDFYLQAEYTNRLAESLLYYTKRAESFRLGFAIVR